MAKKSKAKCIANGEYGIMIAVKGNKLVPVPLEQVAGKRKSVPWITR